MQGYQITSKVIENAERIRSHPPNLAKNTFHLLRLHLIIGNHSRVNSIRKEWEGKSEKVSDEKEVIF
jgi:hypothetical protein